MSPPAPLLATPLGEPMWAVLLVVQGVPQNVWKLGKLNHVAIAVSDLTKAATLYRDVLGAKVSGEQVGHLPPLLIH